MEFIYTWLGYPFGIILKIIFDIVHNYGIALILFTVFARCLMLPTAITQQKNSAKTMRLKPKISRIQAKYAGDQKRIQEETQALYKREGQNPMGGGCAPLVIQMVLMFGLIGAIYSPLTHAVKIPDAEITAMEKVVAVVEEAEGGKKTMERQLQLKTITDIEKIEAIVQYTPEQVAALKDYTDEQKKTLSDNLFNADGESIITEKSIEKIKKIDFKIFGLPLGEKPSLSEPSVLWIVPILSGIFALAGGIFTTRKQKDQNPMMSSNPMMTGCTAFGMPLFTLYISFQFPLGIGLYWAASNLFSFVQSLVLNKVYSPAKSIARLMVEDTVLRRSREENVKLVAEMRAEGKL